MPTRSSADLSTRLEDGSSKGCDVFASASGTGTAEEAQTSVGHKDVLLFRLFFSLIFHGGKTPNAFQAVFANDIQETPSLMRLLRSYSFTRGLNYKCNVICLLHVRRERRCIIHLLRQERQRQSGTRSWKSIKKRERRPTSSLPGTLILFLFFSLLLMHKAHTVVSSPLARFHPDPQDKVSWQKQRKHPRKKKIKNKNTNLVLIVPVVCRCPSICGSGFQPLFKTLRDGRRVTAQFDLSSLPFSPQSSGTTSARRPATWWWPPGNPPCWSACPPGVTPSPPCPGNATTSE